MSVQTKNQLTTTNSSLLVGHENRITFGTKVKSILQDLIDSTLNISNSYEPLLPNPTVNGYVLSSTTTGVKSWIPLSTFTLTTNGANGVSTYTANTLNIPSYTLAGLGGIPLTGSNNISGNLISVSPNTSYFLIGTNVSDNNLSFNQFQTTLVNKGSAYTSQITLNSSSVYLGSVDPVTSANSRQFYIQKGSPFIFDGARAEYQGNYLSTYTPRSLVDKAYVDGRVATKEDGLGDPTISGYVLSSTTTGVRSWIAMSGGGGGTTYTIGTINSAIKSADGLIISGSSIIAQTADSSFPGLLSLTTQSIIGNKTLTGITTVSNTTAATSSTGALVVSGGISAISLYVGSSPTIKAGTGTALAKVGGVLKTFPTTITVTSATLTDCHSYTIPANTLVVDGDAITMEFICYFNISNSPLAQAVVLLNGVSLVIVTAVTGISMGLKLKVTVIRKSATTVVVGIETNHPDNVVNVNNGEILRSGFDFTTAMVFKNQTSSDGSSQIHSTSTRIGYEPANP